MIPKLKYTVEKDLAIALVDFCNETSTCDSCDLQDYCKLEHENGHGQGSDRVIQKICRFIDKGLNMI